MESSILLVLSLTASWGVSTSVVAVAFAGDKKAISPPHQRHETAACLLLFYLVYQPTHFLIVQPDTFGETHAPWDINSHHLLILRHDS